MMSHGTLPRSPRSPDSSVSSPRKKRYHKGRSSLETSSCSSFSQSEDFQKIFDDDKAAPLTGTSDEEVYIVKQRYGYFSMLFSLAQTTILAIMMTKCGVAPLNINPMIGPYPDALSEWGGKNAVDILDYHEWWRLFTPILLHAGVIHLFCNVAVQLETGAFFEREWGSVPWLIIYVTSAVGSTILSVIVMPNAISVGSSGAVMGLFGGKLAEIICRLCESDKTEQGRIGHQVRKEQCAGVTCSVFIVMMFSFIPYGKRSSRLKGPRCILLLCLFIIFLNACVGCTWFLNLFATRVCFLMTSGLVRSFGWSDCGIMHWNSHLFPTHQNCHLETVLVLVWVFHYNRLLCCDVTQNVFGRYCPLRRVEGCLRVLSTIFSRLSV